MKNLIGKTFGRLTVLERNGSNPRGYAQWLCSCECGNQVTVASINLLHGNTRSCGCLRHEINHRNFLKHGILANGHTRTYNIWRGIKKRCLVPSNPAYKNYGGRGIIICDEWLSFEKFHNWAIANGYADNLEIDRINNNGNYEPCNCHWVTRKENAQNRKR